MVGRGWERGREGERVCISNEGMSMEYVAVDKWGGWVERELESAFFWLIFPRVLLSVTYELLERERERERERTRAHARARERARARNFIILCFPLLYLCLYLCPSFSVSATSFLPQKTQVQSPLHTT